MTRREKIFWLIVGAAIFIGFLYLIPFHGEICKEATKAGEENCPAYRMPPFVVIWTGKILDSLGVAITALATIAIAWFTWSLRQSTDKLWKAGKEQFDLSRQEFVATHRPRVILRYIQGPYHNEQGHRFIWLTFVNIGANDAIVRAFGGDLAQRRTPFEDWTSPGLDASPQDIQPVVLACGQRHVFTVTAKTSATADQAIFEDATSRGLQICAVGTIRYSDANGVSRDTGFFRVLDDEGIGFVVSEYDTEMEYQD